MPKRLIDKIPLDALRVFESCARNMNFTLAAKENLVTQAAVSRRIKTLENQLGVELFTRRGKKLNLTPTGKKLFASCQTALNFLSHEVEEFSRYGRSYRETIAVMAAPSVSDLWLSDKLFEFAKAHRELLVRMFTTENVIKLSGGKNDVAVFCCDGVMEGWDLTLMFEEILVPVAAPAYLEKRRIDAPGSLSLDDMMALDLLDYQAKSVNSFSLMHWFEALAEQDIDVAPLFIYSSYKMAIEAALNGHGIVLGCRHMISSYLETNQLTEIGTAVLNRGKGYYVAVPKGEAVNADVRMLTEFLLAGSKTCENGTEPPNGSSLPRRY